MTSVAIIGSRGFPSSYGGFETLVAHLAPFLKEHGFEVTVYCRGAGFKYKRDSHQGIERVFTPGLSGKTTSTLTHGYLACRDLKLRNGHSVALILNVANGYFLRHLHTNHIPAAVNVDGIEWERAKWNRIGKYVFRRGAELTAKHATHIVADSVEIGRIWKTDFGVESTYIPYGADILPVDYVPDISYLPDGLQPGSYLLSVARMVPENNLEKLLAAWDVLGRRYPLVIVGSTDYRSPLRDRITQLADIEPRLLWLGHVDNQTVLNQLWQNAGIYFHGHSVGGTNPALLQALGNGSPTLALHTPFNEEVLTDHPEMLVEGSSESLACSIETLMESESLRKSYSMAGRGIIESRFRWHSVSATYATVLTSLSN